MSPTDRPDPADRSNSPSPEAWALAEPRIRIAPSLLAADFARLVDEVRRIEEAGVEILHLDVMDGHFVPNLSFGVPVIEKLRLVTELFFDVHLMITDPAKYAEPFVKAGADLVTFHIEVDPQPSGLIEGIRSLGARVGVSLNPSTEAAALEPALSDVDLVLVMSVWPGFGGQQFIESSVDKLKAIRPRLRPDQRLEIDGGIGPDTVAKAVQGGADTLVAGSAVFGQPSAADAVHELLQRAESARTR